MDPTQSVKPTFASHFVMKGYVRMLSVLNRLKIVGLTVVFMAALGQHPYDASAITLNTASIYHKKIATPLDRKTTSVRTKSSTVAGNNIADILIHIVDPGVIGVNQNICSGTTPAMLTNIVTPSPQNITLTYHWEKSTVSATSGYTIIPSTNALFYSPGLLTSTTWFRRAATHTGDTVRTAPVMITVNTPTSLTISSNQTICTGSTPAMLTGPEIAGLSFKWIQSTTSATSGFALASGTNNGRNYAPGALTQNTWYRRIDSMGTCPPDTTPAVLISISPPTVGGTVSGGGTFCQGPSYTFLTLSGYTGSILKWQSSTSPTFASNITDITFTSSPYPATTAQFSSLYYRAIVKNGSCPPETSSISPAVIVIPQTVSGQVSGGTTVCAPTNSTMLSLSGITGSILKWQSSLSADFSTGVTDIVNTTTSLTVTNLLVKTYYRAFVQNGSCLILFSGKDSITVAPSTVGGIISGGNTVCSGTNSTTLTLTGYAGNISSWEFSTVRDFSSGVNSIANTTSTYTALNLTGTRYFRAVINSLTCPSYPLSYSAIDSIVVISSVTAGTLSGGTTVCSGTNTTLLTLSGSSGTILKWQSAPNAAFSSGVVDIAHTASTYAATNLSATTYFRVILANTPCPADTSAIDSIVVVAQTVGGTLGGGGVICPGNTTKVLTLNGFVGTILKWQSSPVSDFSSGVIDINNTTNTYTASNLSAITYYRVLVQNANCPALYTTTTSVTPPVVAGTISGGNSYCSSTNNTTFTLTGNTGTIVRWESCLNPTFSSGVTNIANNTNSLNILNVTVTTYYRALINSGSISCAGAYSNIDSIVIFPSSVGGIVSGNYDTVCTGNNATTFTLTGYTGTIQWQASTTSATAGFTNISGANAPTYIANNLSVKTYFRAIVTSGVCTPAASAVDSVLISLLTAGGTVSGNNDTVCIGTNSTTLTLTGYTGTIQWQASTTSASTGFTNISGANSPTYIANNLSVKTYFRAIFTNGSCPSSASAVDSVLVNVTSVGGHISGTDSVCSGTNSTVLTLAGFTGTIIRWESANNAAFTGIVTQISNTTTTHTATNLSATTYFRAVLQNGNCPIAYSAVKAIIVESPSFGGFITSPTTVCINTNSTVLTITGYTGTILRWESSPTSNFSGTVTTIPHTGSSYTVTNISTPMYYRVVVQNGICPSAYSQVGFINVQVQPNPGNVTGGGNVCITSNSTPLTLVGYQGNIVRWESSNTFDFSGTITTITNTSASYVANNVTTTTYYRAVVQFLNCATVNSGVATITVVTPSVGGAVTSADDTVCAATNSTTLTLTGYTGTIQWQASTTSANAGFTNISGANAPTYIANNLSVNTYFRAVVTNGVCPSQLSTVDSILVNAISVGGIVASNNDTVCIGTNSTTLTLTGYTGIIQWQASTTSATAGFTNISGANAPTYVANNLSVKTYFRAVVTNGICPSQLSAVDSILVNAISVGGIVASNNDTVCIGTNSTTLTLTGYTGTIQWQASTTSATAGFTNISGANSPTYVANNLSIKTYFRAVVTNGVCPGQLSAVDSILINTVSIGGTVSSNHDTVCIGTNSTTLTLTGYTGTIQWQASTTSATAGFTNISGANAPTYIANNLSVKTYFRAVVTNGICPSQLSAVDSILINTVSIGGTVSSNNDTVCIGTNSTTLTLTGYTGTIQWQASTTSATTGFTNISGANSPTYIANNLSVNTYFRAVVTNGICPGQLSAVDSILINTVSIGGIASSNQDTVCTGTNSTTLTLTGYAGTIQWQASTTSATAGFTNISGANAPTYIANNLSVKTYFRAVVTNGICPTQLSTVDSILINAISIGGTVASNNDTVCIGTNSTTLTLTGYTGTIQWQASTTSATAGFTNISGANAPTYIANNLSVKTYFRAVVTNGVCPGQLSAVDSILINTVSIGGIVASNNDTVCIGTNSTTLTLTGYSGTIQWQVSTTSATTGFTNISGANAPTYVANNLSVKTYFRAVVTNGICPSQLIAVDSILINTVSIGGTVSSNNDTVCIGTNSTTLTLTGYSGTIQWQASTTSATAGFTNISGANSPTYIASNLLVKTYFRAVVTNGVCPGQLSAVDSIGVNTTILTNTISGNIRLCSGSNAGTLTGSVPTGGNGSTYSFLWQRSIINPLTGFVAATGINNTKDYLPGILTQHTWFRRIVFSAPCSVDTSNIIMDTVSPNIAYSVPATAISIVYGTTLTLPTTVVVKYSDSTSDTRPVIWDTTGYNGNVGTYNYTGTIQLAAGTCNSENITGLLSVNVLPRIIIVKADPKIKALGDSDPPLTYVIISGTLVGSDTFSGTISRVPGELVGKYLILQHTLGLSANYTLIYILDTFTITPPLINVSVSKTTASTFVFTGDSVTYRIRITNNGPDSLDPGEAITVTDQPAPGLTIGSYTPTNGIYNSTNHLLTLSSSFIPGQFIDLIVRARVSTDYTGDSIGNFVFIQLPNDKLNTGDSTDSVYVSIIRLVDLGIRKIVDRTIGKASDTIHYSIIVKNNGVSKLLAGEKITINDFLPDSLTQVVFTPVSPIGSTYNSTSGEFTLGDTLYSGDSLVLNLTGIIRPEYKQLSITNSVTVVGPPGVFDSDSTNDSSWVTLPLKPHASEVEIIVSNLTLCKGIKTLLNVSSTGIVNPKYTWYTDSLLTMPFHYSALLDTLLLSTTSFFITVKGDNKLENIPGTAKKVTITVFDYASDTLILTNDTVVCYGKTATLIAKPKGMITNPVFTWYALPSLTVPIATGDTFITGKLTRDTLYYVTIKGSSLCESRELHIVRVTINRNCGNVRLGLAKSLTKGVENTDGSFDLSFNFIAGNYGDEPLINVKLRDDLKPVFPTAQIKVLSLTTPGNWRLNKNYNGVSDIELLDTGNRFEVGEQQTLLLTVNLTFPAEDTSTQFKNVAIISGVSEINGKPAERKSRDGIEPNPDSLATDTSFEPTPIVITISNRPKPKSNGSLFIPEGFSPNGDGDHDLFVIDNPDKYILNIAVFNRWGNILYENKNYDNSWDGTAEFGIIIGKGVPDGTYFYIVEYTDEKGSQHKLAGPLTIVRE